MSDPGAGSTDLPVRDRRFRRQLDQVRTLKEFMFEEKVTIQETDLAKLDLESLNNLAFAQAWAFWRPARAPTPAEWTLLDRKLSALASQLDDDLRPNFRIRELHVYFVTLPVVFLVATVLSCSVTLLSNSSTYTKANPDLKLFLFYWGVVFWTIAQGGLGACTFLGTVVVTRIGRRRRALARTRRRGVTDPAENGEGADHDSGLELDIPTELDSITNRNFLQSRIILGILFGYLLGLPFASQGLSNLNDQLFTKIIDIRTIVDNLPILLLPFLFGFSTNAVLAALGRLVASIATLLGPGSSRP